MAFQSGDVRGTKTAAEAKHAHKNRPYNMLERSQNVPNDKTRESWDRMFKPRLCCNCNTWSDVLGKCVDGRENCTHFPQCMSCGAVNCDKCDPWGILREATGTPSEQPDPLAHEEEHNLEIEAQFNKTMREERTGEEMLEDEHDFITQLEEETDE